MPQDAQGRYVASEESTSGAQVASAARTTTANGTAWDTTGVDEVTATLTVSAASGTSPTLDVILQTSIDGGTNYYTVAAFTQKTTTGTEGKVFGPLGDLSRWRWTVGGTTPSFTFAIAATEDRS